jgi:hypothetical protein
MAYRSPAPVKLQQLNEPADTFAITQWEYRYRGEDPHVSVNIVAGIFIPGKPGVPGVPGKPAVQAVQADPEKGIEASSYMPAVPEIPEILPVADRVRNFGAWRQILRGQDVIKALDLTDPEGTMKALEQFVPTAIEQGAGTNA